MKVYSVLSVGWRKGSVFSANSIAACSSLEQAKEAIKKAVDDNGYRLLCFKINKDGAGAISTLYNDKRRREEIRILVSNINVAPERLKRLGYFINNILAEQIVWGKANRVFDWVIEANKVKFLLPDMKSERTFCQCVKDDEYDELWEFYVDVCYRHPFRLKYKDYPEE